MVPAPASDSFTGYLHSFNQTYKLKFPRPGSALCSGDILGKKCNPGARKSTIFYISRRLVCNQSVLPLKSGISLYGISVIECGYIVGARLTDYTSYNIYSVYFLGFKKENALQLVLYSRRGIKLPH